MNEIITPKIYIEWVNILNLLKERKNNEEILEKMENGKLEWQDGVAQRFVDKLTQVINYRIKIATDKFSQELSRGTRDERVIVQSLIALKKEFLFCSRICKIRILPDEIQKKLYELIADQAKNIQTSLENSAKNDRTGKLLSIVRNNKISI
jgi:hypothetical protein